MKDFPFKPVSRFLVVLLYGAKDDVDEQMTYLKKSDGAHKLIEACNVIQKDGLNYQLQITEVAFQCSDAFIIYNQNMCE